MPAVYPVIVHPADYRGAFTHMQKRDEAVYRRWLLTAADRFLGFAYDVALGGVTLTVPDVDLASLRAWQYSTALKIDAVAFAATEVWIIEVRPEAHVSALGAVLCYVLVAEREAAFDLPLKPVVVCEYVQPDVKWCADRLGVAVFVV